MGYGIDRYGQGYYGPQFYISPDLGWANLSLMLNPNYNALARHLTPSGLEAASATPTGYISPGQRTISIPGLGTRDLPLTTVMGLAGDDTRYYFRYGSGTVSSFVLRRSTVSG